MATVLVTGATGFIGSHLARELVSQKHTVAILKRRASDVWRIKDIWNDIYSYNVEDGSDKAFSELKKIDAVLHFATSYGIRETFSETISSNIAWPASLLQLAAEASCRVFINADTFFSRPNTNYSHLSTYALSKRQFTELGREATKKWPMKYVNLRLEHVFGTFDDNSKFVPNLIRQLLSPPSDLSFTEATNRRDFIYVKDVATAAALLVCKAEELPNSYSEIEVGTGQSIAVKDFIETAHKLSASKSKLIFGALPMRSGEILDSRADLSPLTRLGWEPKFSLENGLHEIIADAISRN